MNVVSLAVMKVVPGACPVLSFMFQLRCVACMNDASDCVFGLRVTMRVGTALVGLRVHSLRVWRQRWFACAGLVYYACMCQLHEFTSHLFRLSGSECRCACLCVYIFFCVCGIYSWFLFAASSHYVYRIYLRK